MKCGWAFAAVAASLAAPSRGRAEDAPDPSEPDEAKIEPYPAAHHPRIFVGTALGVGGGTVHIDGAGKSENGGWGRPNAELGYSHPVIDGRLGIVAVGRIGDWSTSWSHSRGETRYAFDVSIGPELVLEEKPRRPNRQIRIALPLGYTHAWIVSHDARAVAESYSPGNGFNFGIVGGFDFSGSHSGGYFNLGYMGRIVTLEHTATLQSSPSTFSRESYLFVDHTVYFSAGFLYRP